MDTHSLIKQTLAPLAGKLVLDIGCGHGHLARTLAADGAVMSGIDPYDAAIESCLKAEPAGRFRIAGAEALPFADASFDAALFVNSLHHVPETLMPRALIEAARVTGSRNLVLIVEPATFGSYFKAVAPIEDETTIRQAALGAIEATLVDGLFERIGEFDYIRHEVFRDFSDFARKVSMVNAARRLIIEARRGEIEAGFLASAICDEAGRFILNQPLKAFVLKSLS